MSQSAKSKDSDTKEKTSKYRFDLRDGFTKEDVMAIAYGFWWIIKLILSIIFWPVIWIGRQLSRTVAFFKTPHDRPLTAEEKRFVESIPLFFSVFGIISGILLGVILWFLNSELVKNFLDQLNFDTLVDTINSIFRIIRFIFEVIAFIVVSFIKIIISIVRFIRSEPAIALIVFAVFILVVLVLTIVITEMDIIRNALGKIFSLFVKAKNKPIEFWQWINKTYNNINEKITVTLIGRDTLNLKKAFFKKVLFYTWTFAFIVFIIGLALIVDGIDRGVLNNAYSLMTFIILILFIVGFGTGFFGFTIFARILSKVGKKHYIITTAEE